MLRPARVSERRTVVAPRHRATRTFFGEPGALRYLAFTEAWERFSFYGMNALLVLYMTQQLLMPGSFERIWGIAGLVGSLEGIFGPLSRIALASQIFGLYTGLIYFTPVIGGIVADRWLGRRLAVLAGAGLMSAGHLVLAFDEPFLIGLLLLIVGCGLLKGNITAQVGDLYSASDREASNRGFAIFSIAINVGAMTGPVVCGLLAQLYGWHTGFAAAGMMMIVGMVVYTAGYNKLAACGSGQQERASEPLSLADWQTLAVLLAITAVTVFQSIAFRQGTNMALVWINDSVDLGIGNFRVPVPWFVALDSTASIVVVPFLFALWRWQARLGRGPSELHKIGTGAWLTACANFALAAFCMAGDRSPLIAPVIYNVILGVAFLYQWPTLLALVARTAPAGVKSTCMGGVFLSLFVANIFAGWLGGFYDRISPQTFFALHGLISAVGGIMSIFLARPYAFICAARDVAGSQAVGPRSNSSARSQLP